MVMTRVIKHGGNSLSVIIPRNTAEMLGITQGTMLYIDWYRILKETNEMTVTGIKHLTTDGNYKQHPGENKNGKPETRSNVQSRRSQSHSMEQRERRQEGTLSNSDPQLSRQGQEVAGNEQLQHERPDETPTSSGTSVQPPSNNEQVRRRIRLFDR